MFVMGKIQDPSIVSYAVQRHCLGTTMYKAKIYNSIKGAEAAALKSFQRKYPHTHTHTHTHTHAHTHTHTHARTHTHTHTRKHARTQTRTHSHTHTHACTHTHTHTHPFMFLFGKFKATGIWILNREKICRQKLLNIDKTCDFVIKPLKV